MSLQSLDGHDLGTKSQGAKENHDHWGFVAEGVGFEPTEQVLPAQPLSRRLPSTDSVTPPYRIS